MPKIISKWPLGDFRGQNWPLISKISISCDSLTPKILKSAIIYHSYISYFLVKFITLLSFFDPVGQKWPFRSPKENRWLFCILLPPKKYYKPYFPGGSLRITDQYIWKKLIFATNNHKSPKNRQEGTKIF